MRFRNYRNSFNKRNRIYSDEDLLEMKLAAIFDNENDIIAQNRDIGIPTRSELESSQNTQWVEPFVDKNGMNVADTGKVSWMKSKLHNIRKVLFLKITSESFLRIINRMSRNIH